MTLTNSSGVANYDANPSVHVLEESGNWSSISLGASTSARFPEQLATSARTGALWARIDTDRGGGIYVYSPEQQSVRYVTSSANDLPSSQVNDLAVDKNDEVWVATRAGVAFFQSSLSPFIPDFADAIIPIFNGELLLKDEFISAVAVDGGNRKWFGTNIGLWLFSENGDELVYHFTRANSPLPSDSITNVAINPLSGEVFISTTKGLVSYRSDATDASTVFSTVKVFPNPVTPDYRGIIGFSGLASNVNVKVTDIAGRLVREFFANGGTASWD
ncbi:MAG: two-component regulator propeller domain-containing protein, partial [Cyclobacteriaceae bacterium]